MTTTRGGHPSEDHVPDLPPFSNPGPLGAGGPPEGPGDSGGTAAAGSSANASDGGGRGKRLSTMMVAGLAALGLGIAVGTLPVPYVIESPGPTYNTLGETQGHPVINVSGRETYPAAGSLDLTWEGKTQALGPGDCLRFRIWGGVQFNAGPKGARYLVVVCRS